MRTVTSGSFVGEYFDGSERMDIIMRGSGWSTPEDLAAVPVATPLAGIQTIGELTRIDRTVGPTQLLRVAGDRTVTLSVLPPEAMTVEEALDILRDEVGPAIAATLPPEVSIQYRGTADKLDEALAQMGQNLALAVLILFFIMAAMFRSLRDSALVIAAMPVALSGGVIALNVLNLVTIQSLDLLTMIGFIILMGLVVNNAILLVLQTRAGLAAGANVGAAVHQAVRTRARPIAMSTLTSIFGMLPLALIPGVGSEIYRGLAVVIIGGMVVQRPVHTDIHSGIAAPDNAPERCTIAAAGRSRGWSTRWSTLDDGRTLEIHGNALPGVAGLCRCARAAADTGRRSRVGGHAPISHRPLQCRGRSTAATKPN